MTLGKKLKKLRKDKGLTQEQLSTYLNLSSQNISNYERNTRQPSYEVLKIISSFFNISTDYLLDSNQLPIQIAVTKEEEIIVNKLRDNLELLSLILDASDTEMLNIGKLWNTYKTFK